MSLQNVHNVNFRVLKISTLKQKEITKYRKTPFCSVNKSVYLLNTLKNVRLPHPRVLLDLMTPRDPPSGGVQGFGDPLTTPGRPVTCDKIHYLRKKPFILTPKFPEFSGSRDFENFGKLGVKMYGFFRK